MKYPNSGVEAFVQYLRDPLGAKKLTGTPYWGCTGMVPSAGSRLGLPHQLGREKHQQREAGELERGQLTNRGRGAPARRWLGEAPTNPRRPNEVGFTGCDYYINEEKEDDDDGNV